MSYPKLTDDASLDFLRSHREVLEAMTLDSQGKKLPLFQWRPLCPPWHKDGGLHYQKLVPYSKARINIVAACNRGGKTRGCLVPQGVARARGQHPLFSELTWKLPQKIWVGANPKFVGEVFKLIWAFLPKMDKEKVRVWWSKGSERIEWPDGTSITMKSYGMDRDEWQFEEVNFLALDEEPPKHIWDEAMMRLNAPDSQCLIAATLVEASPFLFEIAEGFPAHLKDKIDDFDQSRTSVAWFSAGMDDNPTLTEDYKAHVRHVLRKDPDMLKIRYYGEPTELAGQRIFREILGDVKKAVRPAKEHYWFTGKGIPENVADNAMLRVDVYDRPRPHMRYVMATDLAEGLIDGDWTTCHVICVDTSSVVAKFKGRIEPGPWGKILAWLGYWYNTAVINWEHNMQGAAVEDRLNQMHYPNRAPRYSFAGRQEKALKQFGFRTTGESKHAIIQDLRDALGDGVLVMPDQETYDELANFGYLRKEAGTARLRGLGALTGHDDLVMSLAIAWFTTRFAKSPHRSKFLPQTLGEQMIEAWERGQRRSRKGAPIGGILP